jgi:hypothetical protein
MFNGVTNGYINGWYSSGARFDILITPDTGAGEEHYILRSTERTVFAAFPHRSLYDIPGKVERRENNKVVECLDNTAFGLAADDLPYLCGIAGAHADFVKMLSTGWRSPSTLAATLQTQEVREQFEVAARKSGQSQRMTG